MSAETYRFYNNFKPMFDDHVVKINVRDIMVVGFTTTCAISSFHH